MKNSILLACFIWYVSLPALCLSGDILIDNQGRKIEAEIISVGDQSVLIRKAGSTDEINVPLSRLNQATLQLIANKKATINRMAATSISGEWKRLKVELPNPADEISGSGMGSGGLMKIGARNHEIIIRKGGWLKVNIRSANLVFEQMVQFDGTSAKWTFSMDEHRMLLSKDSQPPEVIGVTLVPDVPPKDWFSLPAESKFAKTISVETQENDQVTELDLSPVPITAILATNYKVSKKDCEQIAAFNPKGLAIDIDYEISESIMHFEGCKVEAWSLEYFEEPYIRDGNKRAPYPVSLPNLPNLKYLNIFTVIP